MADTPETVLQMDPATLPLSGSEILYLIQGGLDKQAALSNVIALLLSAADPNGTAAAALAAHLSDYTHGNIAHTNRSALDLVSGVNTGDQDLTNIPTDIKINSIDIGAGPTTDPPSNNARIGQSALSSNTTGYNNFAAANSSLKNLTTGHDNTFGGISAGENLAGGSYNAGWGTEVMKAGGTTARCFAGGYQALYNATSALDVAAIGYKASFSLVTGNNITAFGSYSLQYATNTDNSAFGASAGNSITTGRGNSFFGSYAGFHANQKVDAVNSTAIGQGAYTTKDNQVSIGNSATAETVLHGAVFAPVLCLGMTVCTTSIYSMVLESSIIVNYPSGTFTLVLPAASAYPGRIFNVKTIQNQAVVSSVANIVPLAGGTPTTSILPATAGKFAMLHSDGTNWQIMMSN